MHNPKMDTTVLDPELVRLNAVPHGRTTVDVYVITLPSGLTVATNSKEKIDFARRAGWTVVVR